MDYHKELKELGLKVVGSVGKLTQNTIANFVCDNGHEFEGRVNVFVRTDRPRKNAIGCSICRKLEEEKSLKEEVQKRVFEGHRVESLFYKGQERFYNIACASGHSYIKRAAEAQNGCPECNKNFLVGESRVKAIFEVVYKKEFKKERLEFLKNEETGRFLELDGFNKELMIAFEYQGRQHHFENTEFAGDFDNQVKRDALKEELCKKQGITLIKVNQPKTYTLTPFLKEVFGNICEQLPSFKKYSQELEEEVKEKFYSYNGKPTTSAQLERQEFIASKGYKLCSGELLTVSDPIVVSCQQGCPDVHTTFEAFKQHYSTAYRSVSVVSEPCSKCKLAKNEKARKNRTHEEFVKELAENGWVFSDNKKYKNQNESYIATCAKHPNVSVEAIGQTFVRNKVACVLCDKEKGLFTSLIQEDKEILKKEIKTRKNRTHNEFVDDLLKNGWILKEGEKFEKLNSTYTATCSQHPNVTVTGYGGNFVKDKVACLACRKTVLHASVLMEHQDKAKQIKPST